MNKEMTKEKNIDITKYETIHDHHLTEGEQNLFKYTKSKEDYLKNINYDLDKCYYDISSLYHHRYYDNSSPTYKNIYLKKTSEKYYSMISEKEQKRREKDANDIYVLN